MPISKDVNIEKIAEETEGYSGADIDAICREAGIQALREDIDTKEITAKHFKHAMSLVKPSLTKKDTDIYASFAEQFKSARTEMPKPASYLG
jgi:transitional endoplasmic reticulum ATPase